MIKRDSILTHHLYDGGNEGKEEAVDTNFMSVFDKTKYDRSLIVNLILIYFIVGVVRLLELGMYVVFAEKLHLSPAEITLLVAITATPRLFKVLLAICSDSVTCCGTRRKSYLVINSIFNTLSVVMLMWLGLELGKDFIVFCIMVAQFCMTWLDCLADALTA